MEPDVKTCNSWNEEDIPTSIHCLPTGHSSSSDEESYADSVTAITNEEVIEAIKSAVKILCSQRASF